MSESAGLPAPIVMAIRGDLLFLHGTGAPHDPLSDGRRVEPYPSAEAIEEVVRLYPTTGPSASARFSHGRAANNLGAVQICTGKFVAAFDALFDAERTFVDMVNEPLFYVDRGWSLTGLAMVRYNAAVLYLRWGDPESGREKARAQSELAEWVLSERNIRDQDEEFIQTAIRRLPLGTGRVWMPTEANAAAGGADVQALWRKHNEARDEGSDRT